MDLPAIRDAFERVSKKQKVTAVKTNEVVDKLLKEVSSVKGIVEGSAMGDGSAADCQKALMELKGWCGENGPNNELAGIQREFNATLGKYGKLLDKSFYSDISKICRSIQFDTEVLNEVIVHHLYREGLFDLGDFFAEEAQVQGSMEKKGPFFEMLQILEQIRAQNLEPVLAWATAQRQALLEHGSQDFEFKLHRLQFVNLLHKQGRSAALKYARKNFGPFAGTHMHDIQRLMGCLLWAGRLDSSPYADLLEATHWDSVADEFGRECCALLGESHESALQVTISAGAQAVPALLKLVEVLEKTNKRRDLENFKQYPIEIELDKQFQFHSIFACPVSRDQSSAENPPMLMPCGHVLCKQSILKLAKGNSRQFKCPYCPMETTSLQCKQLYF